VHRFKVSDVQPSPPSWGLDRIDQAYYPLNGSYTYPNTAPNVTAYIIDTGIRYGHQDFGGRATFGFDAYGGDGSDCYGHGTSVAGVLGGTTYGVAKGVQLVSVRVLDCAGEVRRRTSSPVSTGSPPTRPPDGGGNMSLGWTG
jgi:subtilisin family serine protease